MIFFKNFAKKADGFEYLKMAKSQKVFSIQEKIVQIQAV